MGVKLGGGMSFIDGPFTTQRVVDETVKSRRIDLSAIPPADSKEVDLKLLNGIFVNFRELLHTESKTLMHAYMRCVDPFVDRTVMMLMCLIVVWDRGSMKDRELWVGPREDAEPIHVLLRILASKRLVLTSECLWFRSIMGNDFDSMLLELDAVNDGEIKSEHVERIVTALRSVDLMW